MKSPFPGMDPFIEARHLWGDFHDNLIVDLQRAIQRQLPARYVARINDRVFYETEDPEVELILKNRARPDVEVIRKPDHPAASSRGQGGPVAIVDSPLTEMHALIEYEEREIFVDVYKLNPDRQLVTSVEVLSPTNKRRGSAGWDQYERKRSIFAHGHANLVEIDLLRRGRRHPMSEQWPDSPFVIAVFRREKAPAADVWPAFVLKPLPTIPIPLLPPDGDIAVELQPLVSDIYESSRYFDDMRYEETIQPPLRADEAQWLSEFLASRKPK